MNQPNKQSIKWFGICAIATTVTISIYSFNEDKRNFEIVKSLDTFYSVFRELNTYYVDDTNPEKLIKTGIDNMLQSLDPYTTFIPEDELEDFKFITTGEYGGIGSVVSKLDSTYCYIHEIYQGFPADKAGLKAGDKFLKINDESMLNKPVPYLSERLRGTSGTTLTVTVAREGVKKPIVANITRQSIQINPVSYYGMVNDETGIIMLNNFTQDCSSIVEKAFIDLRDKQHAKKLILDLRENPGGTLDDAIKVVNMFVPKGMEILSTRGRIKQWDKTYKAMKEPIDTIMPIAVLISRGSASASEIVAGALQDLDRAVIIGNRSFGKGLVQSTRSLAYNSCLKITTAKYYIPSGRCIQALDYSHRDEDGAVGLVPDSLISEFKTKCGRSVFDGGGISPDIKTENDKFSNITYALVTRELFFKYALKFAQKHSTIASAKEFTVTPEIYSDFKNFVLAQNDFKYESRTSEMLKKLVAVAQKEEYYNNAKGEFEKLEVALKQSTEKDLEIFEKEIKEFLALDIVRLYYYQKGSIISGIKSDTEIFEAIKLLQDTDRYVGLLNGTVASHAGDKRMK